MRYTDPNKGLIYEQSSAALHEGHSVYEIYTFQPFSAFLITLSVLRVLPPLFIDTLHIDWILCHLCLVWLTLPQSKRWQKAIRTTSAVTISWLWLVYFHQCINPAENASHRANAQCLDTKAQPMESPITATAETSQWHSPLRHNSMAHHGDIQYAAGGIAIEATDQVDSSKALLHILVIKSVGNIETWIFIVSCDWKYGCSVGFSGLQQGGTNGVSPLDFSRIVQCTRNALLSRCSDWGIWVKWPPWSLWVPCNDVMSPASLVLVLTSIWFHNGLPLCLIS